jgi:hypothetical protein
MRITSLITAHVYLGAHKLARFVDANSLRARSVRSGGLGFGPRGAALEFLAVIEVGQAVGPNDVVELLTDICVRTTEKSTLWAV